MQEEPMTINGIIAELTTRVANNIPISPASWVEAAMRLEILATNLDNDLAIMQAKIENLEAELVNQGSTSAKAKTLAKKAVNYQDYLSLKAKIKRIDSFIVTARKRSQIREM